MRYFVVVYSLVRERENLYPIDVNKTDSHKWQWSDE